MKTNLWEREKKETDDFREKLSTLVSTIISGEIARDEVIDSTYMKVHNSHKTGEDGQTHMEDFESGEFHNVVSAVIDVYRIQELCNIFRLEKSVKAKTITAYIGRHKEFRPHYPPAAKPYPSPPPSPAPIPQSSQPRYLPRKKGE